MFSVFIFRGFGESRWMADTAPGVSGITKSIVQYWHLCVLVIFQKKSSALDATYSWRLSNLLVLLCRSWAGRPCTEGRVCQSSPLRACRRLDGGLGLDQIDLWFHWHHKHVLNSLITFSYSYYATWWHLLQATLSVNWRTCEGWCLAGCSETWLSMRNALGFHKC